LESDTLNFTYIDPALEGIIKDLSEYTQISIEEVRNLVMNRQPWCYKREFSNRKTESNHFFNLSSAYFMFGNAKHGNYENDISKIIEPIMEKDGKASLFEFGCGAGNISLAAKEKYGESLCVYFNELSALQKDFVQFRFHKRNQIAMCVHDWQIRSNSEFLHGGGAWMNLVIALDVFEHIEDYPIYVNKICKSIKIGGFLWEGSYFLENRANDPCHHVEDKFNYKEIIKSHGFVIDQNIKMSEGNLWKKQ
jgi:cyclopropane fatty-acyl-phospholipid synthase-like methyltransferase